MSRGVLTLNETQILQMLRDYPLISSVEEMCEIRGCSVDDLTDARREYAERKIHQNVVKLKNKLKTDLMKQAKEKNADGNIKALITLYQLMGDDDDLRRLGTPNMGKGSKSTKGEVLIKAVDPDMIDKLGGV